MWGAFCRNFWAFCKRLPQLDIGAVTPRPRKLNALSTIMEEAIAAVDAVIIVGRIPGKIWLKRIRKGKIPRKRA